jgi:hypothetical protein
MALANIMSEGTARINSLTNEELDKLWRKLGK